MHRGFDTSLLCRRASGCRLHRVTARSERRPFARHESGSELFASVAEKACFDALPSAVHDGWTRAVDYYVDIEKPDHGADRQSNVTRLQLAGVIDVPGLSAGRKACLGSR